MTPRFSRLAAAALAVALLGGCAESNAPGTATSPGAGYQAGDGSFTIWQPAERGEPIEISGQSLDGKDIDSADWAGDVAVVNFWYAACPPCRAEAPDLKALSQEFTAVHFLGINPRDDQAAASAFEDTFEVPYPTILDPSATIVASMQGKVPLQAMPTTVVIDKSGRVSGRILGRIDPEILKGLIEDALAESS
ncbi:Thiol-disulfide isomerase or thioredoxin [Bowdeniella nasicola]|uniref:Thiol-disulfide isomerase or thioredoxin n=1 Tax=Bowdeniella nasicola TaxID=208480 RepID=A0A1H3XAN7_9ACTO|nr:TlpA disulfide reductase family protein [Bowdeniella nasicola]SDZ95744.1 Thiol-disulfide isomerase or thioredoxin [Bowdeniella nasicola]